MNTGKVVLGALAGFAAGALLGVLIAPDKGSETRRKISQKGLDTADDLKAKFDELLTAIAEKFESVKEDVTDLYEEGKHKAEEFQKEAGSETN